MTQAPEMEKAVEAAAAQLRERMGALLTADECVYAANQALTAARPHLVGSLSYSGRDGRLAEALTDSTEWLEQILKVTPEPDNEAHIAATIKRNRAALALPATPAGAGEKAVLKFARRAAFLGAHINDREDGADVLARELHRLYDAVTGLDGGEEPDLTFCCGCREEIEIADGQEQWVLDGAKYHKDCYAKAAHIADKGGEKS